MRFTLIKDIKQDSSMRPILTGLLLFILLFLLVDIFVKSKSLGFTVQTLYITLLGDKDQFIDPLTLSSFLELLHADIFFMMMLLLTLSAIFARVSSKGRSRLIIINISMVSALLSVLFLVAIYFYHLPLALLFILSFFLWHLLAFHMTLYTLKRLYFD